MRGKTQGFSLIEMLVVMTIMGLIVSIVTLSTGAAWGDDDGSPESVADQLMTLMAAASSQAMLSGEPVALSFAASAAAPEDGVAVTWLRYGRVGGGTLRDRQTMWQPVSEQAGLYELNLPSTLASELTVEGEQINTQVLANNPDMPVVVFYPTGESTPFQWSLVRGEQAVTLSNATNGNIARSQL